MKGSYLRTARLDELDSVAEEILQAFHVQRIFALSGEMGAGKTTLVQAFCRQLEVTDTVNSPTFSIVNEYLTSNGLPVYHFDLYRIKKPEEVLDIGGEDYFFSGSYCFIEWPEQAERFIPEEALVLSIEVDEQGERIFRINETK